MHLLVAAAVFAAAFTPSGSAANPGTTRSLDRTVLVRPRVPAPSRSGPSTRHPQLPQSGVGGVRNDHSGIEATVQVPQHLAGDPLSRYQYRDARGIGRDL